MGKRNVKLSPGEMEMLSMLWKLGPLTIAEAHESIGRPLGYTTIQTRLNRLVEKGIVDRTEDRPAKYAAAVTRSLSAPTTWMYWYSESPEGMWFPWWRSWSKIEISRSKRFRNSRR